MKAIKGWVLVWTGLLLSHWVVGQARGTLLFDTLQFDGRDRSFIVFEPAGYDGLEPVPLVLNLHGAGSNAAEQVIYSQLNLVADTAGFLVVIPDAVDNFWNSGFSFIPPGSPDDVAYLLALVDSISARYPIDPNRIYSTGMSNGGFMSYRLACEAADRFAAIASVTGSMADNTFAACDPSRVVPVLQIHGTADLTVPYEGSSTSTAIADVVAFWRANNECPELPVVSDFPDLESEGCTVQAERYFPCRDWSEMLLYRVDGGGHTWPGSFPLPGAGCTNLDIRANAEVWQFFRRHNLENRYTGLDGNTAVERGAVFPNPSSGIVYVRGAKSGPYSVFNPLGEEVMRGSLGSDLTNIDLRLLPAGLYWLRFASGPVHRLLLQP
jgi:polyhydroxybutyrate depolymerase